ncbi:hypothetical protein Bbelb_256710 [Branchiostoma belcheri]|nr:hypothetical protein Bbelb_256710 [Branchiostoma belcheri]
MAHTWGGELGVDGRMDLKGNGRVLGTLYWAQTNKDVECLRDIYEGLVLLNSSAQLYDNVMSIHISNCNTEHTRLHRHEQGIFSQINPHPAFHPAYPPRPGGRRQT